MSWWRRAPRAVYRVYGEDEYLAGADMPAGEDDEEVAIRSPGVGPGRLLALGLLIGVTASAVGLLVLAGSSHSSRERPPDATNRDRAAPEVATPVAISRTRPSVPKPPPPRILASTPRKLPVRRPVGHTPHIETLVRASTQQSMWPASGRAGPVAEVAEPDAVELQAVGEFGFER